MASRLEKLLEQLEKNAETEAGVIKLAQEDVELLQALGAAYVQGIIDSLTKHAEDQMEEHEMEDAVDLDGDGVPDHIIADEDEVAEALQELVESGELHPDDAVAIADAIDQYNDEISKTASAEQEVGLAAKILNAIKGVPGAVKGFAERHPTATKATVGVAGAAALGGLGYGAYKAYQRVRGGRGLMGKVRRAMKNKRVVIPLAIAGGIGAGAAGYMAYRHFND